MTPSSTAPADGTPAFQEAPLPPMFYVVSRRKLAILYLSTFTLYTFYWFYKNWDLYKGRHPEASKFGTTIWPVPRAVFPMFFTHSLFAKVKAYGHGLPQLARWRSGWHATFAVAWMLLSEVVDSLIGGLLGDLVSIVAILPLLFFLLHAQGMINAACGDAQGLGNERLTRANKIWIAVGALFWVAAIGNMFLSDDEDTEAPADQRPAVTAPGREVHSGSGGLAAAFTSFSTNEV
jgi:hypothetical protein